MNKAVGICIGASSVSLVEIIQASNEIKINKNIWKPHYGKPKETFLDLINKYSEKEAKFAVTGRKFRNLVNLSTISEPEATEISYNFLYPNNKYSAIITLGAETFLAYILDEEGKISNVVSKNQCASGTGEFFLQQIKRMNLDVGQAVKLAENAEPYKVSGRCSVFCKSDCTHALNKGVEKGNVTSGLALMMADKVEDLLKKFKFENVLAIGGVTKNSAVMNFLKQKGCNIDITENSTFFEALGAAIYSLRNNTIPLNIAELFTQNKSSFTFHNPLENFKDKVTFKQFERGIAQKDDICSLGLDVGSTTTKAVLVRLSDKKILSSVYLYTHGNPIEASKKCYQSLSEQLPDSIKIIGLGTTGSGRHIAGLHALTEAVINEIVAHATAAVFFDKKVDTIFEIGGQDAKYTYIINKVPADYAMNEACYAGTGSFIEEAAYETLGVKVEEIEAIAMQGSKPPNFSDQCAAFISSDIKTALHENIKLNDIVAGLVYSICLNYVNRVKGNRVIGEKIFMQGGVCYNKAIPIAMAAITGKDIIVPPEPGLMGAFGVALEVIEKLELGFLKEKEFSLSELAQRNVVYKKPFICSGGKEKCDLACTINLIEVQGKNYPFGGVCNKYYNIVSKSSINSDDYDFVKVRQDLMFNKYAEDIELPENSKTIGISQSFHTHTIYPLYYNFFTQLGFKVVLSDEVSEEGLERENTAFCFPCQLSLGFFQNLLDKRADFYFIPNILEMYVENECQRKDFNCTCALLTGEPLYLKQAFKDYDLKDKLLTPQLDFSKGWDSQEQVFISIAKQIGFSDENKIKEAYQFAVKKQVEFQKELLEIGKSILKRLETNPEEFAMVLIGRPYNSFSEFANKGIPKKFASRGIYTIPYDMLDFHNETIDDNQYWEGGKKILKSAKVVKKNPQLFSTYISNFSCAPDSLIMNTFRTLMGTKPSLTLELDGHTADAGINTRIDAVLDIIKNYRKLSKTIKDTDYSDFVPAQVITENDEVFFISSDGEKIPLNDNRVVILIPSMGELSSEMFAAMMRGLGFNAVAASEGNPDILRYGRANTSGKECLPLILLVGSMMDYIENQHNEEQYFVFFIVQGAGNCRLGQYPVFIRDLIKRRRLKNVAQLVLMNEDGFAGLGAKFSSRGIQALIIADVLEDIRTAILANSINPEKGIEIFNNEFDKLLSIIEKEPQKVYNYLNHFSNIIRKKIPARIPIEDSKYIALCGEIFCRRDGFSHKWLNKTFAKQGFIIKDAYISEWIFYVDYLLKLELLEPSASKKNRYERKVRKAYMNYAEYRVKKILAKSGYYEYSKTDVEALLNRSKHIVPLEYKGEPGLTLGVALHETLDKYCGVINLGPFGCMPTRLSEAVSVPEMKVENKVFAERQVDPNYKLPEVFNGKMTIPFLTIESDGNAYPQIVNARLETFALQAERVANLMIKARRNGSK